MDLERLEKKILADDEFRKEYYKKDLAVEIGEMVIDARVKLGLTQTELANMVGTKQPSIARLETGDRLPNLSFLQKIATSLGTYLTTPKFAFLDNNEFANKAIYATTAVVHSFGNPYACINVHFKSNNAHIPEYGLASYAVMMPAALSMAQKIVELENPKAETTKNNVAENSTEIMDAFSLYHV